MAKKLLLNLLVALAYTGLAYGIAVPLSPDGSPLRTILTIAVAYGFGNIHFVLWFMIYTRRKAAEQDGQGAESKDELDFG